MWTFHTFVITFVVMMDVLNKGSCISGGELTLFTEKLSIMAVAVGKVPGEQKKRILHPIVANLTRDQSVSMSDAMSLKR